MAIPFSKPAPPVEGAHILGQPFTVVTVGVPMNMTLRCNCGGAAVDVTIANSVAAACPSCKKLYNALFNPTNGQIAMQITVPEQKEPS